MANREVNFTKRVSALNGLRYCAVVLSPPMAGSSPTWF